ncbi:hypothetical protein NDN08_004324 [Rhodosorus marinus]|uniref:Photolyase/cryptochrome alpha/beta domain-containing protein n=1 Tax=Rhodosorus marinus TaxID=101924 RepID=A0AAV8UKX9_9RHOD|nr:hypothetical protein NDN08_004324 [Rhodosorus marinus]
MQPHSRGGYGSQQDSHNIGSNLVNEEELLFFPPEPLGPGRTQSSDVPVTGRRTDGTSSGGSHASPLGGMSEPGTGSKGSRRSNRKKRRRVPSSLREVIYGIQGDPQASSSNHVTQEEHDALLKPDFDWPGALYLDLSSPGAPWYRRPSIVLFRKSDLRVDDNLALHAAVRRMTPLLLVLIMEPDEPQDDDSYRDAPDFRMSDSLPLDIEIVDGRAPRIVPRDMQRRINRFVRPTTKTEHTETIGSPITDSFQSVQKMEVDRLLPGEARHTAPGAGRDLNGDKLVDVWNIQQRASIERAPPIAGPSGEKVKPFGTGTRQSTFCNWWMNHSIQSLSEELAALGADLVLRPCRGRLVDEVSALVREVDADAVYFNRSTSARDREKEVELSSILRESGVACYDYRSDLLVDSDVLLDCTDFETFMSRWRRQLSLTPPPMPHKPLSDPVRCFASHTLYSTPLDEFELVREDEPGAAWIAAAWGNYVGCDVVQDVLTSVFEVNRNNSPFFDLGMLGPKLSFGEISPRVVYHFMQQTGACSDSVLRSICLREWDDYKKSAARRRAPLDAEELFRRRILNTMADYNAFEALKKGMTGFPVIDASMNQLNQDGWLPMRNEFVLVVFSIVLLRVPWQEIATLLNSLYVDKKRATVQFRCQLFERMLIPAEKITQGPNVGRWLRHRGFTDYVKRYLPEMSYLPDTYVLCPWKAPRKILSRSRVSILGLYECERQRRLLENYELVGNKHRSLPGSRVYPRRVIKVRGARARFFGTSYLFRMVVVLGRIHRLIIGKPEEIIAGLRRGTLLIVVSEIKIAAAKRREAFDTASEGSKRTLTSSEQRGRALKAKAEAVKPRKPKSGKRSRTGTAADPRPGEVRTVSRKASHDDTTDSSDTGSRDPGPSKGEFFMPSSERWFPQTLHEREKRLQELMSEEDNLPSITSNQAKRKLFRLIARNVHQLYEITDNTDRRTSRDSVRLCIIKDHIRNSTLVPPSVRVTVNHIKKFFQVLNLLVTGEWDRRGHGGVRGPYVYGLRPRLDDKTTDHGSRR